MNLKKIIQQTTLVSWCFVMGYFIIFGSHGAVDYARCLYRKGCAEKQLAHLEKNIAALKQEITSSKTNDFYREKKARYDFCMGYTNEMIYLLRQPKDS